MTTILRASPRRFVNTPAIERIVVRALRYLQSGFSIHLRGPAGTGKTTLALHLADLITRPIMLIYGDDEFKTSDLIGNQTGYTRKKVVDNFIHSVVKVEDELRQNWVDSRLTLACREGFTLVYDEFNRSRPEVNNVLLSALEEKLLVLPPNHTRNEYLRVNPQFRAILTSNPEEYCGVHDTQDALMDRLITINIPAPDELTQQEILVQKTECDRASALLIVRLVRTFRQKTGADKSSGLRSGLMLAKICQEHDIVAAPNNADFRDICADILLSRAGISLEAATKALWEVLNEFVWDGIGDVAVVDGAANSAIADTALSAAEPALPSDAASQNGATENDPRPSAEDIAHTLEALEADAKSARSKKARNGAIAAVEATPTQLADPWEQEILEFLRQNGSSKLTEIEKALQLDRFRTVDTLRALMEQGKVAHRYRLYVLEENA